MTGRLLRGNGLVRQSKGTIDVGILIEGFPRNGLTPAAFRIPLIVPNLGRGRLLPFLRLSGPCLIGGFPVLRHRRAVNIKIMLFNGPDGSALIIPVRASAPFLIRRNRSSAIAPIRRRRLLPSAAALASLRAWSGLKLLIAPALTGLRALSRISGRLLFVRLQHRHELKEFLQIRIDCRSIGQDGRIRCQHPRHPDETVTAHLHPEGRSQSIKNRKCIGCREKRQIAQRLLVGILPEMISEERRQPSPGLHELLTDKIMGQILAVQALDKGIARLQQDIPERLLLILCQHVSGKG